MENKKLYCKSCGAEYTEKMVYNKQTCENCLQELFVEPLYLPQQLQLNI